MALNLTRSQNPVTDLGGVAPSEAFWDAFFEGSRRACARLISKVENEPGSIPLIRDRLASRLGKAVRIGFTGPPGVGKSTLSSAISIGLAEAGHRVGVIAVDPSSPFTGGAFMGDRVRMGGLAGNDRIFMRSLASRDGRGGLSPSTPYVADVIEGFGMDRILIETVGVGQAELDVLSCADIVVLVLQPSTGDAIQTLKAGIIEGADIVVVNKSDLPGVDSAVQALRFVFGLASPNANRPAPPLLQTSAQQSEGIAELLAEIERQATHLNSSGMHLEMRQARLKDEIRAAIRQHLWALLVAQSGIEADIETVSAELASSGGSHYPYVREICSEIALKTPIKLRQRGLNEKPV